MAESVDSVQKPIDLDLHCLPSQDISGTSRTRVKSVCVANGVRGIGVQQCKQEVTKVVFF